MLLLLAGQLLLLMKDSSAATCGVVPLLDGSEYVLTRYPTYQIIGGINSIQQYTCHPGGILGYAVSKRTITLDSSMTITCEEQGWWMRTSANLAGNLLVVKVACFKILDAPPTLPTQCQTGIDYYTDPTPILNEGSYVVVSSDRPTSAGGKWALLCRSTSVAGYVDTEQQITVLDATMMITCESSGWWIKIGSTTNEPLRPSLKVGCFVRQMVLCPGPDVWFYDGSESIIAANAAVYQLIKTVPSTVDGKKVIVCPTGSAFGYAIGDTKLSIEPELKVTCESGGWWVTANWWNSGAALNSMKIGCFKELPTSLPDAPVSTVPKTGCGCWYERSTCRTCDSDKLFVLEGQGNTGKCTLGCANGYVFEGGEVNLISCKNGAWIGSSRTKTSVTVPYYGPFGYITASCVPAPTPGKCDLSYSTFACDGCDLSKIIGLSSTKSSVGCVLACDKDYRLLVMTSPTSVIRAQEAVAEPGFFTVYRLGDVKNPIKVVWSGTDKYSCEPVTADPAVPVKVIDMSCTGPALNLFDGSEPIIVANADAYQFIRGSPSFVAGKKEFVCPTGAALGYPIGDKKLSIEPALKLACESAGWWLTASWWNSGAAINGVKIGCFKELPSSLPPAPIPTAPKTACGCWYERATCRTCDSEKLFVLEGQGVNNGKCTLGCASGYMFEGGEVNMISCMQGNWIGSSRTQTNAIVAYYGAFGYITASCVPAPTPGTCPLSYSKFECEGCDASKLIGLASPKSSLGCVLACDKDYRLLVMTSPTNVIRAQEAVAEPGLFTVYPLGDVKNPIKVGWTGSDKYSCEPVTADPAVPVKVIDTPTPTTTTPTVPSPPVEACGCHYTADVSNPAYDSTKLFTMDSGTGRCTLQCDQDYRLAGAMSSASCKDGKTWYYEKADSVTISPDEAKPSFSCEAIPGVCGAHGAIDLSGPCRPEKECSPSAIRYIKGAKSSCIVTCSRGYQLVQYSPNFASPYTLLQEAWHDQTMNAGAGGWKGVPLGETGTAILYVDQPKIILNCERYISPAEQARIPPDSEKRRCGCPYDFSGCPTCAWQQMFRLDGFGDTSGYCALGCGKGYMFEGGRVNMLSCKKGQGWFGSSRLTPYGAPISMGSGDKITTSCVPVPAAGSCSVPYATFTCASHHCDYHDYIVPLSSPRSSCVLACDIGHRLLVLDADRKVIRAQEAVLEDGMFKVYPLGDTQHTISIPSNVIKFSCEGALMSMPELIPL